jgi:hypothetical protein
MATEDNSILLHMPDRGIPAASQEAMQEQPTQNVDYLTALAGYAVARSGTQPALSLKPALLPSIMRNLKACVDARARADTSLHDNAHLSPWPVQPCCHKTCLSQVKTYLP